MLLSIATFSIYIILWLLHKLSNICKPEEGWYAQPKYCYKKKQYTLFWISFAVVFGLLVFGSLYFGWLDLFSRDSTFTTSNGFCS